MRQKLTRLQKWNRALAKKCARRLFVDDTSRLVMETERNKHLPKERGAGWSEAAIANQIEDELNS